MGGAGPVEAHRIAEARKAAHDPHGTIHDTVCAKTIIAMEALRGAVDDALNGACHADHLRRVVAHACERVDALMDAYWLVRASMEKK